MERLLAYRFGTKIDFGAAGNGLDYELSGFGLPENWGTWTDGPLARLGLCLVQPVERDLNLVLGSYTYVGGEHQLQEGQVVVNGTKLGTFTYQQAGLVETRALRIPKVVAAARGGEVIVEMLLPNAFSPAEIGKSDDQRKLGLGLVWATIAPTEH